MTIWDIFEPKRLFYGRDSDRKLDDAYHLAEIVAIIGPPPIEFVQRSEKALKYWDGNGNWIHEVPIPDLDMSTLEVRLSGKDKEEFLRFMRRLITWVPEERPTAVEVVYDDWMMEGLGQ